MKSLIKTGVLGLATFTLISCSSAKMSRNNENLLMLEMGMTKEQVMKIMEKPDLNEAYLSLNEKSVTIFFYYTEKKWSDYSITKDECTPVVFEEGKLVGWGDEFYKYKLEVDINVSNN